MIGYPIDLDHAIYVKDPEDPSGEPRDNSPSSKHRTGTAPFMSLDLLKPPRRREHPSFPTWHLPRYDVESFIWVFCWTLHHFKMGRKKNGTVYRKWKSAPQFDQAFNGEDRAIVRAKKWQWASTLPTMDEVDQSFNSLKPLMVSLVNLIVDAYIAQEGKLRRSTPGVLLDFVHMDGHFVIDDVIQLIQEYYDKLT